MKTLLLTFLVGWLLGYGTKSIVDHDRNEKGYQIDLSGKDLEV